jgi:hypothetical protein
MGSGFVCCRARSHPLNKLDQQGMFMQQAT